MFVSKGSSQFEQKLDVIKKAGTVQHLIQSRYRRPIIQWCWMHVRNARIECWAVAIHEAINQVNNRSSTPIDIGRGIKGKLGGSRHCWGPGTSLYTVERDEGEMEERGSWLEHFAKAPSETNNGFNTFCLKKKSLTKRSLSPQNNITL